MSEGAHRRLGAATELLQGAVRDILQEFEADPVQAHHLLEDEVRSYELRHRFLPDVMRDATAWRVVVELYQAGLEERRSLVKDVCLTSAAPPTTVLRNVNILVNSGWIIRESSETDGRYTVLVLSRASVEVVESWLEQRAANLNALIKEGQLLAKETGFDSATDTGEVEPESDDPITS